MDKHYSPIDNITSIKMQWQLKSRTGNRKVGGSTTTTSICACRTMKYNVHHCAGSMPTLVRGERILIIRRRVTTVNGTPWYKSERWRTACFTEYLFKIERDEAIAYPLEAASQTYISKRREEMGEYKYEEYVKQNAKLRMYKGRLIKYQANLQPTSKTLAAMANCEYKIETISKILEGEQWQTKIEEPSTQTPISNLQPPEPEKWKEAETPWIPNLAPTESSISAS